MQELEGYARRYNIMVNKDKTSGYSSKNNPHINSKVVSRDITINRERSGDSKIRTKESSLSNVRVQQGSKSTCQISRKQHRKQLSKPSISRNHSSHGKDSSKRHTRLNSEVTTAATLRKTQQQPTQSMENSRPTKTTDQLKNDAPMLSCIYERVNTILEQYKRKEMQWKQDKVSYERKIALLVNQLAKTQRLR